MVCSDIILSAQCRTLDAREMVSGISELKFEVPKVPKVISFFNFSSL